jgi:hypothetical protein
LIECVYRFLGSGTHISDCCSQFWKELHAALGATTTGLSQDHLSTISLEEFDSFGNFVCVAFCAISTFTRVISVEVLWAGEEQGFNGQFLYDDRAIISVF